MSKISQYARIGHHRITQSGGLFTVPTSNDHTDGTWLSTDLYIGEIGINVTDNTAFMRTNTGIVQIGTSASTVGGTNSNIWTINGSAINISSTYSIDDVSPRSGYYTDLGSTSIRWKDLYLGGRASGVGIINSNAGLSMVDSGGGILTSNFDLNDNSPFKITGTVGGSTSMDRPLHINSKDTYIQGSGNQRVIIASNGVIMGTSSTDILVSGQNVTINQGVASHVHLGYGYNKTNYSSYQVVAGGSLAVRGVADDGSTQYNYSDWVTKQAKLRTSNAASTTIATIPWPVAGVGSTIQIKAYIMGVDIADCKQIYSAEALATMVYDGGDTNLSYQIGDTVLTGEVKTFVTTSPIDYPYVEFDHDATNSYIKVCGTTGNTIQWLVSFSYHQLTNITV